jgi:hypothetical protein
MTCQNSASEPGGRFAPQLMSNEDSAQAVVPALERRSGTRGAYIGVGSEVNFTYIAAARPSIAFILDIRRDNLLQHLLYKALFELAPDRTAFVSRLFSRHPSPGARTSATARELFDVLRATPSDSALLDDTKRAVAMRLTADRGITLSPADLETIARFLDTFASAGPDSLKGYGDGLRLTYAELMAATDPDGRAASYLESEDRYQRVRDLHRRNLIIPITGDFAGEKALRAIGDEIRRRGETVSTFYVSNVERYLFDQGTHGQQFYANVATLPTTAESVLVRSVTTDISKRLAISIPDGRERWRTFLDPIRACLDGISSGRIQSYRDLFAGVSSPR